VRVSRAPGDAGAAKDAPPLYLTFADNTLLGALYGEHDRNLARIEQKLGIWVTSRGNRLALTGAPDATNRAKRVLLELYHLLEHGVPVGSQEVDAALRLTAAGEAQAETEAGVARLIDEDTLVNTQKRRIVPRSPTQAAYVRALHKAELIFGIGPAGTGKTYLAVAVATAMFARGEVDRIILSRPAVEAGERLGFLPGDLREKIDPYLRPLYDALYDMMPADRVIDRLQNGEIEIAPLAFMRGRTLANAFVILDEAQNTTPVQMKMFLTRLGENSRMAVTGDLSQIDLPVGARCGLEDALAVATGIDGVQVVRFSDADVVRHELVTQIVRAYEKRDRLGSEGRTP
jgi:phosphate starvation-inducible PhoH-like protein